MKKAVYNPLSNDFSWEYLDENNNSQTATMLSHEITYFEPWVADLLTTHLADKILHERGIKTNAQDDLAAIKKEIQVDL